MVLGLALVLFVLASELAFMKSVIIPPYTALLVSAYKPSVSSCVLSSTPRSLKNNLNLEIFSPLILIVESISNISEATKLLMNGVIFCFKAVLIFAVIKYIYIII